jgi:hypothetical protein
MTIGDAFAPGLVVLLLIGCSSPSEATAADGGSGADGAVLEDGSTDAIVRPDTNFVDATNACNALDLGTAPAIDLNQVASQEPTAMGGTVFDGTYYLTKWTIYTGPGGATGPLPLTLQVRRDFAGGIVQTVQSDGSSIRRFTATLTTAGTAFTETDSCPGSSVDMGTYTATATTMTEWVSDKNQIVEVVFTKQ